METNTSMTGNNNSHNLVPPIDPYNVLSALNSLTQQNDDQEICVICQDILDNGQEQIHILPECSHSFHTNCIITWFRDSTQTNCPCCGDLGINKTTKNEDVHNQYSNRDGRIWRFSCVYQMKSPLYKMLQNYTKRKDCPKELVKLFDKMSIYKKDMDLLKTEIKAYTKERDSKTYKDVQETNRNFEKRRTKLRGKMREITSSILKYPIVPLILPIKKVIA